MFLLDANVLIEAKNRYYAFDVAPGFWTWLDWAAKTNQVCSIEPVKDELVIGTDQLSDWAQANPSFFRPIDQPTAKFFPVVSDWAAAQNFTPAALNNFTSDTADFSLVAYARAHGHVVVTHERASQLAKKRVLIPNACAAADVAVTDTFDMLRSMGANHDWRFHAVLAILRSAYLTKTADTKKGVTCGNPWWS